MLIHSGVWIQFLFNLKKCSKLIGKGTQGYEPWDLSVNIVSVTNTFNDGEEAPTPVRVSASPTTN